MHILTRVPLRCGNVASILELNEDLRQEYKVFESAPHVGPGAFLAQIPLRILNKIFQDAKGIPAKRPLPEYCE